MIDNDKLDELVVQQRRMTAAILTLATVVSRSYNSVEGDPVPSLFSAWHTELMKYDLEQLKQRTQLHS